MVARRRPSARLLLLAHAAALPAALLCDLRPGVGVVACVALQAAHRLSHPFVADTVSISEWKLIASIVFALSVAANRAAVFMGALLIVIDVCLFCTSAESAVQLFLDNSPLILICTWALTRLPPGIGQ